MLKLPNNIRIQIARKANSNSWKISELLEVIKVEIERMKINESKPTSPWNRPNHITASALTARSSESFKLQCVYCKGEHYSASCKTVKNVRECIDVSTVFERDTKWKIAKLTKPAVTVTKNIINPFVFQSVKIAEKTNRGMTTFNKGGMTIKWTLIRQLQQCQCLERKEEYYYKPQKHRPTM